jgi:hypothetical protein
MTFDPDLVGQGAAKDKREGDEWVNLGQVRAM